MHTGHSLLIALYEQHFELETKGFERYKGTTPTFA
jgi:hypothetical protein